MTARINIPIRIEQNIFDNLNQVLADYNGNGEVAGGDFVLWQRSPSVGLFADWEAHYGTSVPSPLVAVATAVPEPNSMILIGCGGLLAVLGIRRPSKSMA